MHRLRNARRHGRRSYVLATTARYFIAIPVLFFGFEQFMHGDQVPGVPLARLTPTWIYGHAIWTYLAAVVYAVTGTLLLAGKKTRPAATWLGATVLLLELVVYVPIGIADRASVGNGLNYVADTLMFCGAVLLLAAASAQIGPNKSPSRKIIWAGGRGFESHPFRHLT
ncbi:MAG TPA: hypothetical protein VH302_11515 [Bryobacteraceae bacterium]|nr:hypothetical protein [Bryobacteraceae bacterium]